MIARLQKAIAERDKGFTLVELLVVIVIIGILAGIAIPMFLSQRRKATDGGVKSDLTNIGKLQEVYYVDAREYAGWDATANPNDQLVSSGDNMEISTGNFVYLITPDDDAYCLVGWNEDGNKDSATNAFWYASDGGGLKDAPVAGSACDGITDPTTAGTQLVSTQAP